MNVQIKTRLPETNHVEVPNEQDISKYMQVLRKTNEEIGKVLLKDRLKTKAEKRELKRLKNANIVKQNLESQNDKNQNKHSLRKRIKQMRRDKIFPLPKSYTNYKNRKGLLKKNTIKIKWIKIWKKHKSSAPSESHSIH